MRATVRMQLSKKTANSFLAGTGLAQPMSIPASVGGWDQIASLANMPEDHAVQLDNWIPRPGYLEIRRGSRSWATGVGTGAVETLMAYNSPNLTNSKLFAVGGGKIYDATISGAATVTTITGLTNNRLQYCVFTNAASHSWLPTANGADAPNVYDGTSWAAMTLTPPSGLANTSINSWTSWMGRLWCTFVNSTQVGYLGIGNISGAITGFDLGPQLTLGGSIIAIATWTQDSKQTVDEYIAFISSKGQVIVYQGTDPSTATTFALVGNYVIGTPIGGPRCFLRISGNLWIICVDGILPMSEMLSLDRGAAAKVAPTTLIQNAMAQSARLYKQNFGWQLVEYALGQLVILNIPQIEDQVAVQYVMNTLTGSWCQFVGVNADCWVVLNDVPYFGSAAGNVYQWDYGSGDYVGKLNLPITATVQTAFNYFNSRGHLKRWTMTRPILNTDGSVNPGVGLNIDFGTGAPISFPSTPGSTTALWDVSLWDQAIWPVNSGLVANWTTVEGIGQCASIITTVSTSDNGTQNGVTLQLNGWDLIAEPAAGFF